ncbi:hypothetical protein Glove_349g28 [Diversispora epigaea]|uniref:Uncharacterized protein n=1 Tax=Diversispora epigaea TaxID=1348612 RepID=A0A397HDI3_9GLOM|nr:hypothetical protein Glove_349g28 [Diversispora epigaea]
MAHLVSNIEALLLKEPLDTLCGASAIYLTIENNILSPLKNVRVTVDHAVNSSLLKIEESERRTKVLKVLSQFWYVIAKDHSQEEIEKNINELKNLLEHSVLEADVNLYEALKQILENIHPSSFT